MSEDVKDISKRLAELEESEGKRRPSRSKMRRPSPALAAAGILGISALGVAAILAFRPDAEQPMDTASPAEFQTAGQGFGSMSPSDQQIEPARERVEPLPVGPSAADQTLLDALAALQAEVESLKAQATASTDGASSEAIDALNAQIAALQESANDAQQALKDELQTRDQELARLRSDLELAQLQASAPQPYEDEGDPALQDLERRRIAEEEARRARITSPLIAFSNGASGGATDGTELERARLSENEAFVREGGSPAEVTRAEIIANPSNTVTQGTMIQAVTETALDSSLPGGIRAIVAEDVHSYDGSRVLIPRGSRLIGRYRSDLDVAQKRILVAWDRIILPDNQTVEISAYGGDELGRSGTGGFVDTRFADRFFSATLISLIGAVPSAAAGASTNALTADTLSNVGGDLESATQGVIGEYLSISPTIHVDQGTLITVMVDRDLEIY